jgi:hypothetical protein
MLIAGTTRMSKQGTNVEDNVKSPLRRLQSHGWRDGAMSFAEGLDARCAILQVVDEKNPSPFVATLRAIRSPLSARDTRDSEMKVRPGICPFPSLKGRR